MAMLFMKCKDDGVIGIAWLDNNGSSRKALLMCGFLGYELGMINHDKDNILWTAGTQYLLDDPKLIRDIKDVKRVLQLALIEEIHRHDKIEIIPKAE